MRLTETDASFVYMETASGPMHISSVYVLDDEVPFEAILEHFEARIHLIPSYRRKLAQIPFSLGHPKLLMIPTSISPTMLFSKSYRQNVPCKLGSIAR